MLKISACIVMEDLQEESLTLSSYMSSSFPSSSPIAHPLSIDAELWLMAEERIQEILCTIQPAVVSEEKRKEVINYVQRLINGYYGIEVFPFGSVPLKTYLPDGDIDLTVLSHQNVEEDLAKDVCNVLESEEKDSVFEVKDVQYVPAQVKIIKCNVKNIPVDISFNQMAGLSALCFLEKVDQLIGKDHLFKQSIILIKAWCYYESRILGAPYGLISTYALEMLVLYIINLFHSSLCGPLAVLHRFLDYYSTFDWDNFCVSINGPVAISSLPEIVAEMSENDGDELLLSQEFLQECREIYSVPIKALENTGHEFAIKHLNIVDPLKDNNNLGRSVSKGNFHRIRCALSYGAQKLGEILMLPGESIGVGLEKFFMNTLDRNGKGQRPDVQVPIHAFGSGKSEAADLSGDYDSYYTGLLYGQWYHDYTLPVTSEFSLLSSPRIANRSAWDTMRQFVTCKRNVFYRWGREVFVPRLSSYHPYASQLPAATFSLDEAEKSRGTGTYIPDMTRLSFKEIHTPVKTRNSESLNHVQWMKSSKKVGQDEHLPEKNNGENDCCVNLSLEEFPLLPVTKKAPPSENNHQFEESTDKSTQVDNCRRPMVTIMFGTYKYSLTPARTMKDSGSPTSLDSEPDHSVMEKQNQPELCESDNKKIPVKLCPYQLRDVKDFPPLS